MEKIKKNLSVNFSTISFLNEKQVNSLYSFFSDCTTILVTGCKFLILFCILLYLSKRLSCSALPAYYSSHTIHLLNNLKTAESKLSFRSNSDFSTTKSELLHSIDIDTFFSQQISSREPWGK